MRIIRHDARARVCGGGFPRPHGGCSDEPGNDPTRRAHVDVEATEPSCGEPVECRRKWSRTVAKSAGYKVVRFTGSAWIAQGHNRSFYIWATEPIPKRRLRGEAYRVVRRVNGVPVYADGIRLTWRAPKATVWVESGPLQDSIAPKPTELHRLVSASMRVPISY